jgi:sn-glycerol 3-phosphate transport system permease protein
MQKLEKLELKQRNLLQRLLNRMCRNPYILVTPAVVLALIFTTYPIIYGVYVSFCKWDIFTNTIKFVGFDNYAYLFSNPEFGLTIVNTLIYVFTFVVLCTIITLLLGVFLNKDTRPRNLVSTIMFTPYIISYVSIAVVWMWLMDPKIGIINYVFGLFGLQPLYWMKDSSTSLMSVLIVALWRLIGYGVLIVISGLRSIPDYVYEAARLDRSSKSNTFFHITVPMLSPTLFFLIVTTTLDSFCTFDIVKLMTNGGPNNSSNLLAFYIYQTGFEFMRMGEAMAAAVLLLILTALISAVNFLVLGKKVHYQ